MKVFAVFSVVVCAALVSADPSHSRTENYPEEGAKSEYQETNQITYDGYSKQLYHGMYMGNCDKDGFYYSSEYSFMMCSNGQPFEQRCAPGSKNSGHASYEEGIDYYIHDFCDVNMVDTGYNGHVVPPKPTEYEVKVESTYTKPAPPVKAPAYEPPKKVVTKETGYQKKTSYFKSTYQGMYHGSCGPDGFYYNNDVSFVMCSNGNAYVQRCAPGARNSVYRQFQYGGLYNSMDFCDVNLVDYGYGVPYRSRKGFYFPTPRFAPRGFGYI